MEAGTVSGLEMLSDYTWRALAYLAAMPPHRHSATTIARSWEWNSGAYTVLLMLREAEELGLVQRGREVRGPWMWELTDAGRAALATREAP
jgi:DNA-binding MarR family transcriptional regulator